MDLSHSATSSLRNAQDKVHEAVDVTTALRLFESPAPAVAKPNEVIKVTAQDFAALEKASDAALEAIAQTTQGAVTPTQVSYILANFADGAGRTLPLFEVGDVASKEMYALR